MQHTFAQTYLTDVHTWSLRFPAAHQQSAVIFLFLFGGGGGVSLELCIMCFRQWSNKANKSIFPIQKEKKKDKTKESQTNVEETNNMLLTDDQLWSHLYLHMNSDTEGQHGA